MIKLLLLGNYNNAQWHEFAGVDKRITQILSGIASVHPTEEYDEFTVADYEKYDVVMVHSLKFEYKKSSLTALVEYIVNGGAMVAMHASILSIYPKELIQLCGGAFKMHPPYRKVRYQPAAAVHSVCKGVDPFVLHDEPFQFHFAELTQKQVFLNYCDRGHMQPAGWCQKYGLGRVVYLQPGHEEKSLENPMLQQLIGNSVLWACRSNKDFEERQ